MWSGVGEVCIVIVIDLGRHSRCGMGGKSVKNHYSYQMRLYFVIWSQDDQTFYKTPSQSERQKFKDRASHPVKQSGLSV